MKRPTFEEFKAKALQNPEVKAEYEALEPAYKLREQLIALRQEAGLTQEEMAGIMKTNKSNISRLESPRSTPKLSTIERYAAAAGFKVELNFVPTR